MENQVCGDVSASGEMNHLAQWRSGETVHEDEVELDLLILRGDQGGVSGTFGRRALLGIYLDLEFYPNYPTSKSMASFLRKELYEVLNII